MEMTFFFFLWSRIEREGRGEGVGIVVDIRFGCYKVVAVRLAPLPLTYAVVADSAVASVLVLSCYRTAVVHCNTVALQLKIY